VCRMTALLAIKPWSGLSSGRRWDAEQKGGHGFTLDHGRQSMYSAVSRNNSFHDSVNH